MSVFKSQYARALDVIPTDNANIPNPTVIKSGTNTSTSTAALIDSTANFNTLNVSAGDIVYNTTNGLAATVIQVVNNTTILLNADIFTATAKAYIIYNNSSQSSIGSAGCNLYVGGAGNVKVTTIGGDVVTFTAVPVGTVLPVQVVKVHSVGTTATLIIALW